MQILHLSDLHFGTVDDANLWYSQLAQDLTLELHCERLDAVVLSGDISNSANSEEYAAAEGFLTLLRARFHVPRDRLIIVPGNHDVNWGLADKAYPQDVADLHGTPPNREMWQDKFRPFKDFYERATGRSFLLDYSGQFGIIRIPAPAHSTRNLLVLGLNSAWNLDRWHPGDASILPAALSNALDDISNHAEDENSLKFAVWHHPIAGEEDDRIHDSAFLDRLAQAGFCLAMHGHIHKAENGLYRYDHSATGRRLELVGAGTFGASKPDLRTAYPWQYQLLRLREDEVVVETRRRAALTGTWRPDARWTPGPSVDPLPRYSIPIPASSVRKTRPISRPLQMIVASAILVAVVLWLFFLLRPLLGQSNPALLLLTCVGVVIGGIVAFKTRLDLEERWVEKQGPPDSEKPQNKRGCGFVVSIGFFCTAVLAVIGFALDSTRILGSFGINLSAIIAPPTPEVNPFDWTLIRD